eukprot:FR741281.1.p1 GENE.FR741281.1~~FR741281.1.p1  ORF type:complete len:202 (-),score=29.21 FR741281.1:214-819(-)
MGGDNNFTRETAMTRISPSAQLTLIKGTKSGSSTAVAAALELVDPLGSGPWLSLTAAAFFFFFFFLLSLFYQLHNEPARTLKATASPKRGTGTDMQALQPRVPAPCHAVCCKGLTTPTTVCAVGNLHHQQASNASKLTTGGTHHEVLQAGLLGRQPALKIGSLRRKLCVLLLLVLQLLGEGRLHFFLRGEHEHLPNRTVET